MSLNPTELLPDGADSKFLFISDGAIDDRGAVMPVLRALLGANRNTTTFFKQLHYAKKRTLQCKINKKKTFLKKKTAYNTLRYSDKRAELSTYGRIDDKIERLSGRHELQIHFRRASL